MTSPDAPVRPPHRPSGFIVRTLRLDSLRNKILLFAVGAALLPSVGTAVLAYRQNRAAITQSITQQLETVSEQGARELDLWLKERLHELRTFASSYEVSENMERLGRSPQPAARLNEFLTSVHPRFLEYAELFAIDLRGRIAAATAEERQAPSLANDWQTTLTTTNQIFGRPVWDSASAEPRMMLLVPIRAGTGRLVGALGADARFRSVRAVLRKYSPGVSGRAYLSSYQRDLILSSDSSSAELLGGQLPPSAAEQLFGGEGRTSTYAGLNGAPVIGILRRVPSFDWVMVAEVPVVEAYEQVRNLRNATLLIVLAVLVGVGLIAYWLGLVIVRPLDRLTQGAAVVASGDFSVDLPPGGEGEVGYLTDVFNDMVARLREGRQRLDAANETLRKQNETLERLSVTDGLTGLHNRRRLREALSGEVERCKRHRHAFSVLMMDVDHFKKYNDAHGHQAGDEVLRGVGAVMKEVTREIDFTARYGGEEFFMLLPETSMDAATEVAERIRERLRERIFAGGRVTVSIGIAGYPQHGDTPEALIASADAALYRAKREGRDRVIRADAEPADSPKGKRKA